MHRPPSLDLPLELPSAEAPARASRPSDFGAPRHYRDRSGPGKRGKGKARPSTDSHPIIGWCHVCKVGLTQVPCLLCHVRAIKKAERA